MNALFQVCCVAVVFALFPIFSAIGFGDESNHGLRSAYLGPDVWANELTGGDIERQLTKHFEVVVERLESDFDKSLTQALQAFEARFGTLSRIERQVQLRRLEASRAQQLRTLRQYLARKQFPINAAHGSIAKPIFVDEEGTHCAVGYLMHRSGADNVVQDIVDQNNFVLVYDLDDESALDWIAMSGLTLDEAAMIQPAYAPPMIEYTLTDFLEPEFESTVDGMSISDLTVSTAAFASNETNMDVLFSKAMFEVDVFGSPYPFLNSFGIGLNCSIFESEGAYYYPEFPTWAFLGYTQINGFDLMEAGDNVMVHRIQYSVEDTLEFVRAVNIADVSLFNFNKGNARIVSFVDDAQGAPISFGFIDTMSFYGGEFTLDVGTSDFTVTTYVVETDVESSGSTFQSLFNEFQREDGQAVVGDMNKDRSIDLLDVALFVDAITNDSYDVLADINQDFFDDVLDVSLFVQELIGN